MQSAPTAPEIDHHDRLGAEDQTTVDRLVDDELLIEEISIDGMCGVY